MEPWGARTHATRTQHTHNTHRTTHTEDTPTTPTHIHKRMYYIHTAQNGARGCSWTKRTLDLTTIRPRLAVTFLVIPTVPNILDLMAPALRFLSLSLCLSVCLSLPPSLPPSLCVCTLACMQALLYVQALLYMYIVCVNKLLYMYMVYM